MTIAACMLMNPRPRIYTGSVHSANLLSAARRRGVRLHASLHFLGRHIFLVRRDMPDMPERIFESAAPVTIELVFDRPLFFATSRNGLLEHRVDICDVDHDAYGHRPA